MLTCQDRNSYNLNSNLAFEKQNLIFDEKYLEYSHI